MNTTSTSIIASAESTFERKTPLIEKILTLVDNDQVQGIIFGSIVHKWLSQIDYPINDLDILFPSIKAMMRFKTMMGGDTSSSIQLGSLYWAADKPSYSYSFSEYIASGRTYANREYVSTSFVTKYTIKSTHEHIVVHGMVLNINMFDAYDRERIQPRNYMTACLLSQKVLTQDFLCNMYMNGTIYHKLKDVINVELNTFTRTHKMDKIIGKYAFRGVKFALVDGSALVAPSKEQLALAKDDYRSKGLVVIPLSRKDKDMAGKAPMVAKWVSLSSAYNFVVRGTTANIGIVCGSASGIVCIDVDVKDRGVEMFNKMMHMYGQLNCPTQRTGSGGYHYIFKYNTDRMINMMAKVKCPKLYGTPIGVDMWIQQCQFVAAPSVNYSTGKPYKWIKPITSADAIPEMPEWIYQLYELETIDEQGIIIGATVNPRSETIQSECSSEHSDESFEHNTMHTIMDHPEYLLRVLIMIILFMAMLGFILLMLLVLEFIYRKQLMSIIKEHMLKA